MTVDWLEVDSSRPRMARPIGSWFSGNEAKRFFFASFSINEIYATKFNFSKVWQPKCNTTLSQPKVTHAKSETTGVKQTFPLRKVKQLEPLSHLDGTIYCPNDVFRVILHSEFLANIANLRRLWSWVYLIHSPTVDKSYF